MTGLEPPNGETRPHGAMLTGLLEFIHRLRSVAIPVSMVETLDAMEALARVDPTDRQQFKASLRATLVKRAEHDAAFDALFEVWFAPRRDQPATERATAPRASVSPEAAAATASGGDPASTELLRTLLDALRRNDAAALRALAAWAVEQFGGIDPSRSASARYYLYRVLRRLDLSNLLRRAVQEEREASEEWTALDERLARDEQAARIDELRRLIAEHIQHRLVEIKGSDHAAAVYDQPLIEDVDFLAASPAQLREMRYAIRPLARTLASRIARRRRFRRHGRLDVRRTMRRSLSAGGVPLDPAFRYPRVSRPDLYLLCDVSGSVAEFAEFTMSLLYAMGQEFSKIRSFAFIDGIDEVTEVFEDRTTVLEASHLLARANVVWADGHSDYGNVFRKFWDAYGHAALGPRASVIVTGDARNNYREPGIAALRVIHERARKVYWLNPEPRRLWNTTDSIMDRYAAHCDGVFEARNLRQLADFVYAIA